MLGAGDIRDVSREVTPNESPRIRNRGEKEGALLAVIEELLVKRRAVSF